MASRKTTTKAKTTTSTRSASSRAVSKTTAKSTRPGNRSTRNAPSKTNDSSKKQSATSYMSSTKYSAGKYATRRNAIILGAIIILLALLFAFKSLFVAALVNGQPVSRLSVIKMLEQENGKKALDNIITQRLIEQEAAKRGVNVSQSDIDKQISTISKNIQSQGMTLDTALAQQGMTRGDLNEQVKLQLLLNKMIGTPTVTDKQINDFITANKAQFPSGESDAQMKTQAKQQLLQQAQQQKSQDFVTNLRKNAHITYFVNY